MSRDGISHHVGVQKMVLISAMEDEENKIRAMKAVASFSIAIIADDDKRFTAHNFIYRLSFYVCLTHVAMFHWILGLWTCKREMFLQ